jgi:hypothetical protein
MNTAHYLAVFTKAADRLNKALLHRKQIEPAVGEVLDSVFLKLYKRSWLNPNEDPLTADTRIFFSVWVNDSTLSEQKLFYNIHALKLRKLKGYTIESRKFADVFRKEFKSVAKQWPNVSVKFGPLTLMEGWITIDEDNLENQITTIASQFLLLAPLVDRALTVFKR